MSDGKVEAKEYSEDALAVSAFCLSTVVLHHAIAYERPKLRDELCSPKCGLYPKQCDNPWTLFIVKWKMLCPQTFFLFNDDFPCVGYMAWNSRLFKNAE
jgi:hypothetical protein